MKPVTMQKILRGSFYTAALGATMALFSGCTVHVYRDEYGNIRRIEMGGGVLTLVPEPPRGWEDGKFGIPINVNVRTYENRFGASLNVD